MPSLTNAPAAAPDGDVAHRASNTVEVPVLSVIMPTFQVEDWITETVWSVLNQSFREIELIVVDDGSTDSTLDVLATFDDARMRVVSNPGKGGAAARNYGVRIARGEYIAFADGDDIVPERAYEKLLGQARRTGSEMVVGNHVVSSPQRLVSRDQNWPIYDRVRERVTLADEPLYLRDRVCWNRVIKRTAWEAMGLAFADSKRSNDIRAMVDAYCAFVFDVIPDPVYVYRRRVGASSMTSAKQQPDSLAAHFTQELDCYAALRRLEDDYVLKVYFEGILGFDMWAHGVALLQAEALADERFDEARELMRRLVAAAPASARKALPEEKRLVYGFIGQGDWKSAGIVLLHGDPEAARTALDTEGPAEFTAAAFAAAAGVGGAVAKLVRAAYLKDLAPDTLGELSDDEMLARVRAAQSAVAAGLPKGRLKPRERLAVTAPVSSGAGVVRSHLQSEPPRPPKVSKARQFGGKVKRKLTRATDTSKLRRVVRRKAGAAVRRAAVNAPPQVRDAAAKAAKRSPTVKKLIAAARR